MSTSSSGTPYSRRTSLSRSNMRLAVSGLLCPYGSSTRRSCSKVSGWGVSRRSPTRFSKRSSGSARSPSPMVAASYRRRDTPPEHRVIHLRRGVVRAVTAERPGAQELDVEIDGSSAPAISYPDLCGEVRKGDVVILNTTAMALGLGTGGVHFVIAVEGRESSPAVPSGHVMKARYTPLQTVVASVEETHADALEASEGLRQTPVVCAPLHSMVAPIAAGAKRASDPRVVYVMTDGAALAGGFSRLVPLLRTAEL